MTQEFYGKESAKYKRARGEVGTAVLLFNNEKLRTANNRAYYSIYYALTAVVCLEPIAFKRHMDTIGYFNKSHGIKILMMSGNFLKGIINIY